MECCIELNILNNFLSVSCLLQLELKADDHNYSTWLLYLYLWRKSVTVKAELEILNELSGVRFPLQLELKTDDYRYSTWLFYFFLRRETETRKAGREICLCFILSH